MINKGKKGISLIVLVITIVVIIILATAIIVNIAQSNIIGNANEAVTKSDISNMKDELSMYIADKYVEKLGNYDSKKLQANSEGIWYGSEQQEGTITDILKSMDEKYADKFFIQDGELVANKMTVTVEEEKWLGEMEIGTEYATDIGKIEIIASTKEWINGNVDIEISYTKEIPEGYVIEYRENTDVWQEGKTVTVKENNTKITARLYNKEKDNEAVTNSYTVSNIDKENPTEPTNIAITAGTNSITALASGATDSLSGNVTYKYSIDNATWQDSGIFNGYKSATDVVVYAKAIDKVGNESASISNKGTTSTPTLSGLTLDLTGIYTNSYFKDSVTPKVTYTSISASAYVLQYKYTGGTTKAWTTVTTGTSLTAITANNTNIVFRLYNSTLDDEITSLTFTKKVNGGTGSAVNTYQFNISNVDISTDLPTTPTTLTLTAGINSVTAKASGSTDGISGVVGYQYSLDNSSWSATVASGSSHAFSGLSAGANYTIYARAVDKVEHVSSSKSNNVTTQTPVAKVGTTNYASVTAAINSISTSGTVTLLTNVTENITIASGKNITLNLGGYTLSSAGNTITNSGTVTPYNGTVSSSGGSAIYNNKNASLQITYSVTISNTATSPTIYNYGTTNISNGTISSTAYYAIDNQSGGTLTISGGTVTCSDDSSTVRTYGNTTISGGNIKNTNSFWALKVESGTVNINGSANFTTDGSALLNYGTINFSGGTVTAKGNGVYNPSDSSQLTVSGGTIKSTDGNPISNYGTATLSGGTITNNGTTYYAVSTNSNGVTYHKGSSVTGSFSGAAYYTINSTPVCTCYYGTLNKAIASNTSATIKLMKGLTESVTIASGKNITLDLNGWSLSSTTHTVNNAGTFTVTGDGMLSSDGGAAIYNTGTTNVNYGVIFASTYYTIYSSGTLNISGGTIENLGNSSCVDVSGILNMTGGSIESRVGFWTLKLEAGSTATLSGGTVATYNANSNGSTYGAVLHYGKNLYIKGATLHSDYGVGLYINSASSSATLNSGRIEASNGTAVYNVNGSFMYTGGTMSSPSNYYTIYNKGGYISGSGATIIGGGIKN